MTDSPFTPDEEQAALDIAQTGVDAVIEWMHSERLLRPGTSAIVTGFELTEAGRIVAVIRWETDRPALPSSLPN